ncbi:MAG: hypothetical protein FJX35_22385 [Alphaproteobacteria bacterium]|nr:hypothetical protein [Alphaproteobacteria bacterium]
MNARSPVLTLFQGACGFIVGYALTLLLMIAGVLGLESEMGHLIVPRHPLWLIVPIIGGWPTARMFARLDLASMPGPGKRRRRRLGWRYVRLFTLMWAVVMGGLVLFVGPSRALAAYSGIWDFVRFPLYGCVVVYVGHYLFRHDIRHIVRRWRWRRRVVKRRLEKAQAQLQTQVTAKTQPAARSGSASAASAPSPPRSPRR